MSGVDMRALREKDCTAREDLALLHQWGQLHGAFRRLADQLVEDVEGATGMSRSAFEALWFLNGCPDYTAKMSQLSATLGFSTAGTTKVADKLTEAGLIERGPSPTDRRVILVTLTERGMEVGASALSVVIAALRERVVRPLGEEGFAALAKTIAGLDPGGADVEGCPPAAARAC